MYYTLTKSSLSLILEGSEQVLALRAKITIDKDDITSVEWHDTFSEWESLMVRMPGSYLPHWIMAGSYWTENGWDFVFARKPRGMMRPVLHEVLVIKTAKPRYRRLIVKLSKQNAQEIITWWGGESAADETENMGEADTPKE